MNHTQKLDALTSLRFIAAAMIVISHAHPIFGSLGIANAAPLGQGVSFFFVLSGFILAYNYPQLETLHAVKRFWLARFARVYPLHLVTCILWIALIFDFNRDIYFPGYEGLGKLITNILLLQAWIPFKEWSLSFNGVSWSLSVEFFFYLCFPALITLWRKNWGWVLICLLCITAIFVLISELYRLPTSDEHLGVSTLGTIYFNPLVRILEFSWGIAVASAVKNISSSRIEFRKSQWLALELVTLASISIALLSAAAPVGIKQTLGEAAEYYYKREGLWLIWGGVIAIFALSKGPVSKLLSARPLVYLGEISFALYLCHALLIH